MINVVGTYGGLAGVGPDTTEGGVAGHGAAERSLGDAGDGHCDVVCVWRGYMGGEGEVAR